MSYVKPLRFYLLLLIMVIIAVAFIFYPKNRSIPTLNCKAFINSTMDVDQGQLIFSLTESLQFYDRDKGIIQYEGYVKSPEKSTYLERTIYLSQGVKVDSKTYHFTIDKVTPSPLDTTPDTDFNQLWLENSGDSASINIGVRNIRDRAYVISSPYAPQFVCVAN
ncbi:FidL-like protein [Rahnella sp. PCH160]|uniref:FidL-like protein n=1 Tax=Rahnella sp. PCH160 TaxID=3447928 RepID=UPI0039FD0266